MRVHAPDLDAPTRPSASGGVPEEQHLRAAEALILSGDVPRLVKCALGSGSAAACKAAADHLCALDWPAQPELAPHIIALYTQVAAATWMTVRALTTAAGKNIYTCNDPAGRAVHALGVAQGSWRACAGG